MLRALAGLTLLATSMGCEGNGETALPGSPTEIASTLPSPLLSRTRPLMSTVFRIQVDAPPENAETLMREAFQEIERLETVLSEWRDDSDISKVNALAGKKSVRVSDDTLRVIDAGVDVSMWSRGAFDLSWAALWGLYDFRHGWHREGLCARSCRRDSAGRGNQRLHDLRGRSGASARQARRPPVACGHPTSA